MKRRSPYFLFASLFFFCACTAENNRLSDAKMIPKTWRDHASSQVLIADALKINKPISMPELKELLGTPDYYYETPQPLNSWVVSIWLEYDLAIGSYDWREGETVNLTKNPRLVCQFGRSAPSEERFELGGIYLEEFNARTVGSSHIVPGSPAYDPAK